MPPPGADGVGGISLDDEVGQKLLAASAESLGTSAGDLKSKLDSGENVRDILDESRVSHEDVPSAFAEACKSWKSYGADGGTSSATTPTYNAVDIQVWRLLYSSVAASSGRIAQCHAFPSPEAR